VSSPPEVVLDNMFATEQSFYPRFRVTGTLVATRWEGRH
jgi:hypothetical protein